MIVALAGGVGGAKLVDGLAQVLGPEELLVAVNTGDDFTHLGMQICPDLDTVIYTLAGLANRVTGWGLANESWQFMETLERLGGDTWFRVGDRDLATHVRRTGLLAEGLTLSEAVARVCASLGVRHRVVPVSDGPVRTMVNTAEGELAFQHYFVRRHCEPVLRSLRYAGADQARPQPDLVRALRDPSLQAIIICPSNPYLSVAPMLAVPGLREAIQHAKAPVIAVSPIVDGQAIKGPAAKIMRELGIECSAVSVARHYADLIDGLVVDVKDAGASSAIAALGVSPFVTGTVMSCDEDRAALARDVLGFVGSCQKVAA